MSETTEAPDGVPPPEPTPTPAPEPQPAGDEPPPQREADEQPKEDRRIAQLRARLGAAEREQARQSAELNYYRQMAQQQAPADETPEQQMARFEREADVRAEERLLIRRFHQEGEQAYPDWRQRCDDLQKMGADPSFAKLLVEIPGGVRIAAALADDPAALQRMSELTSDRARAVALGRYAATLDAEGNGNGNGAARTPQAPQVTRAPPPIRPVTGRAAPQFNEYTASGQQLVDRYMKQILDGQVRR